MAYSPYYSDIQVFGEISSEKVTITGQYSLPIADGASGQVLMTDGVGNVNFQDITGFLTTGSIINGTGINWTIVSPGVIQGNVTLAPFTTTNLAEGTNLYYTNERVDDRVSALIQNGQVATLAAPITWQYIDNGALPGTLIPKVSLASFTTDYLAEGVTNLYYTDERVQDAVSTMMQDSATVTWTYNDTLGTLTANAVGGVAAVNVQQDGVLVGTRTTLDFVTGSGIITTVNDDSINNKITIQNELDTSVLESPVIILGAGTGSSVRRDNCNNTSGAYSTVSGGYCNTASCSYSTVSGGYLNTSSGGYSAVGGGENNCAGSCYSTVSGGYNNCNLGVGATIAGGAHGYIPNKEGDYSAIGGGCCNSALGYSGVIAGGSRNSVLQVYSTISGGYCNYLFACDSVIGGGRCNCVQCGSCITIGGGSGNSVSAYYLPRNLTIGGGSNNTICSNSGFACNSTISGGYGNTVSAEYSALNATISGGYNNRICGNSIDNSTVSGGYENIIIGTSHTISGGSSNCIYAGAGEGAAWSVIGGGFSNEILCNSGSSTISGGNNNIINCSSRYSTISGGNNNIVTDCYSTIGGGRSNTVSLYYSTIGGGR
jgi:hypothetical protein